MLDGPRRFGELAETLSGIAPNILTDRLRRLERAGIVRRRPTGTPDSTRLRPHRRRPGPRLGAPAPRRLGHSRRTDAEPLRHVTCGTALEARWYCPTCATAVDATEAPEIACSDRAPRTKGPRSPVRNSWGLADRRKSTGACPGRGRRRHHRRPCRPPFPSPPHRRSRLGPPTRKPEARSIRVVGVGGGGSNAVDGMVDAQIAASSWSATPTPRRCAGRVRRRRSDRRGHHGRPRIRRGSRDRAASRPGGRGKIAHAVAGADLVFVTAGLGGGTGREPRRSSRPTPKTRAL